MDGRTAASVLGVTPGATRTEITRAFRDRAKLTHPDRAGSDEAFITLRRAYELLRATAPAVPPAPARDPWSSQGPPPPRVDLSDGPFRPRSATASTSVAAATTAGGGAGSRTGDPRRDRRGMTFEDHLLAKLADN